MKSTFGINIVGFACLSLIMLAGVANAQTTVSTEQAWSQCLKATDQTVGTRTADNDAQRTAAFKACMAKLGHTAGK